MDTEEMGCLLAVILSKVSGFIRRIEGIWQSGREETGLGGGDGWRGTFDPGGAAGEKICPKL